MADVRTCSKCGIEKPLTSEYWYKNPLDCHGFRTDCKACASAYYKRYYQANRESVVGQQRAYRARNRKPKRDPIPVTRFTPRRTCPQCNTTYPATRDYFHKSGTTFKRLCRTCRSNANRVKKDDTKH